MVMAILQRSTAMSRSFHRRPLSVDESEAIERLIEALERIADALEGFGAEFGAKLGQMGQNGGEADP